MEQEEFRITPSSPTPMYELVPDGTSVTDEECAAAVRSARRPRLGAQGALWHGVSLAVHALLLLVASALVGPLGATEEDPLLDQDRRAFITAMLSTQAERETEAQPSPSEAQGSAAQGAAAAAPGVPAGHGPGRAGGTPSGDGRPSSRATALEDAAGFGMVGVLAQLGTTASSPWGAPVEGLQGASAMWSDGVGEATGGGVLGLTGVGESGGPGTGLRLDGIGTVGREGGFGRRHGTLRGHDASAPAPLMRAGSPSVGGRLPPDLVQRTVRQSFGRFRACYEMGLRGNPALAGRVSVRFVIGRDGGVASAANGGSDLSDPGTVACVVGAFRGLSFPAPPDGIVTVTYPIVFSAQ